ncbi:hypothetical protein TNIN_306551 [Trichonephila inaurata madagascariensis]|uniref:Uncharacterized protein n=1 Tax=Trichonephila inaurata madagascariensis TaxID=2747483 RepID=A0A8X6XVW8_9ARAC|nr:hypothetical protein TNIN_306551 [Trichonephila inaurata madagascariensis]
MLNGVWMWRLGMVSHFSLRSPRFEREKEKKGTERLSTSSHLSLVLPHPPFLKDERRRNCRPQMLHEDKFVPIKMSPSEKYAPISSVSKKAKRERKRFFKSDREI